jgi:hypothetical protein
MIGSGRGGGGGFGGFPYRSAHQQGTDGRNNRGGRGRGGRRNNRQPQSTNISLSAELDIPSEQHRIIVGRGGTTLKWLKEISGANIHVPHVQQQNRRGETNANPVRVKSSDIPSILHAFHEISDLLSKSNDIDVEFIPCTVKLKAHNTNTTVHGKLFITAANISCSIRFKTENSTNQVLPQLHAYSIETATLDAENVATIVDNVRFVDSSADACHWYYREASSRSNRNSTEESTNSNQRLRRIIFVFGNDSDNPKLLFDAICEAVQAADDNVLN